MPDLPQKKVGLIACSGEELACGTLSRVAVRLVLEELRPGQTVTLCLPLFLAGEKEERAFARFYPTIAVDGCDKWCARRATETYSAPVAGAVRVDLELTQMGIEARPSWRRELDVEGWQAARALAQSIATKVDGILGVSPATGAAGPEHEDEVVTCSCGSGIPVTIVEIGGKAIEVVALPLIFEQLWTDGQHDVQASADELLKAVRIYNPVPAESADQYREALAREYQAFLLEKSG